MERKSMSQKLLENSHVRITTLVGTILIIVTGIGGLVGFAIAESMWRTNMSRDMEEIQKEVKLLAGEIKILDAKIVGRGPNGWHKRDMNLYVSEFKLLNPDLKLLAVENEYD